VSVGVEALESFLTGIEDAAAVAAEHAEAVDREGRFPAQALLRLREAGALGAAVPSELGGAEVPFRALCTACFELGRSCASTAMVFAMHQIQVACIARHLRRSERLRDYLAGLARDGRLIASATSERGTGGDLGQSIAALSPTGQGRAQFAKAAPVVSYGAHADDLLITLRRGPDAERSDQVLVLVPASDSAMEPTGDWDALGMRGTCSSGFELAGEVALDQVVPEAFSTIAAETMVPYAHILWSYCWLGIATDAVARARAFERAQVRGAGGAAPGARPGARPGAKRISQLSAQLATMRATINSARDEYESICDVPEREALSLLGYALRINTLKVTASEAVARICGEALEACGIAGYRNDTKFSVGRHLRDALSAPLMVANDRIHLTNAELLLLADGNDG
jgi:acyl-CoA dehydrogenase